MLAAKGDGKQSAFETGPESERLFRCFTVCWATLVNFGNFGNFGNFFTTKVEILHTLVPVNQKHPDTLTQKKLLLFWWWHWFYYIHLCQYLMPCWVWWVCGVQPVLSYSSWNPNNTCVSIIEQFYCVATDLCELVFTTFSFKSNGRCQRSVKRAPFTATETAFSGKKLPLHLNLSTHPTKSLLWICETRERSGFE